MISKKAYLILILGSVFAIILGISVANSFVFKSSVSSENSIKSYVTATPVYSEYILVDGKCITGYGSIEKLSEYENCNP